MQATATPIADTWRLGSASATIMQMVGFEPTGEHQAAILRCRKRFKAVSGGEQGGKSLESCADFSVHLFEDRAKRPGEPLLYWLVAADYERTRAEFAYLGEFLEKLGMPVESSKRVDPGVIEVRYPGQSKYAIRIETKSAKDPRTLSMFAPNGIIICEASQVDLETYFKCQTRLGPKRGWLHMAGTYEGWLGWYPGLIAGWAHGGKDEQSFQLPAPTNKHIYPGGMDDPEIQRMKREMPDDFFNERIMGVAAPPRGRVFTEFRPDIHIRDVEYDPELPLVICDDPGYGHAHAILMFQVAKGGQVQVNDEIYERGIITEDLIAILMKRDWWKNPDKKLVIDPNYAKQHQGSRSMAEIWMLKAQLPAFGTKVKVSEGVDRLKSFLKWDALTGAPGIVFSPRCKGVLSELGAWANPLDSQAHVYSWKLDSEGNIAGEDPEPRWNDGLSAIMYGLVERFGLITTESSGHFIMRHHGGSAQPKRFWRPGRR